MAIGKKKMLVVSENAGGRVLAFDSSVYVEDNATDVSDVLLFGSYCGKYVLAPILSRGAKAIIALDAGIGKDEAGISGLRQAETLGVPVAAVAVMSAETSNGISLLEGVISCVNSQAKALGVAPGQSVRQAAQLLSHASPGRPIPTRMAQVDVPTVVGTTSKGNIWAAAGTTAYKNPLPGDVICSGSNSSRVMADGALRLAVKGVIANDAGIAMNNSAVEGVFLLDEHHVPAASVSTMSARLGEGLSTWNDGLISVCNKTAAALGITPGMTAQEAARRMSLS